jgi:hypothetical protein
MNDAEIIAELRESGYPSNLTDAEIETAIEYVIRELGKRHPLMLLGAFPLIACQQDYDLFNPVEYLPTSQGLFPGGLRAYELVIAGDGGDGDPDVFGLAPRLQSGGGPWLGITSYYSFFTPGDWVIWDQDWSALSGRFAAGEFEHVNDAPGSPIRIYPVPQGGCSVILQFTRARTLDQIRNEDHSWFIKLVEGRVAHVLANKISFCAGVSFGEVVKNDGSTLRYWRDQAKDLWAQGWAIFERNRHEQIASVQRSDGP